MSVNSKFLLKSFVDAWLSWISENKDESSANNSALIESSPEKLFV